MTASLDQSDTVLEHAAARLSVVPTEATPARQRREARRTRVAFSLGIALAIVVAAWLVGGRTGLESIGRGGVNQRLLPKVEEVAPDFTTHDVLGNEVSLSDFRGRPVWLNFWGSWCPPCRAEMPEIQAAYEQLAPRGLVLLAISLKESTLDATLYAARNGATFPILSDPTMEETGAAYPIRNFPTHIFIDEAGVIRSIVLADMDIELAMREGETVIGQ